MCLYGNRQGQDCIVQHATHFCTQIEHRSLEQYCGSHLRHSCSLVWFHLNLTRLIFNIPNEEYRMEAPQLNKYIKTIQKEEGMTRFLSLYCRSNYWNYMPSWAGFTCRRITSNLLAGKAKFCDTMIKAKAAKSGIAVELPRWHHPFYAMVLQSFSLHNMWQRHTKDVCHVRMPVVRDGVPEREFFGCQGVLLLSPWELPTCR